MPPAVLAAAGVAVLVLTAVDVFVTVLHHWGGAGPLAGRLGRGAWWGARHAAKRLPGRYRRAMLSVVGPALIPVTLACWAGLAITGFGLVYASGGPDAFGWTDQTPPPSTLLDALYVSGVTFFTLGFGEITPLSGTFRLLSVLQAGSGFALITLGISYFTSVYTSFARQKALAETVAALTAEDGAAGFVARFPPHAGGAPLLGRELASFRDRLADILSAYTDYPIIHYFVAARARESLLRLVFVARDVSLLLDTAVDPDRCPEAAGLGRRTGLEHAADAVAQSLARALYGGTEAEARRSAAGGGADGENDGMETRWRERFRSSREVLRAAGFPVRADAAAEDEYVARRRGWQRVIRRCAEAVGEDWEEVSGGR
jgi:hypothetical protein